MYRNLESSTSQEVYLETPARRKSARYQRSA